MSCSLRQQHAICFVSSLMTRFHGEVQCLRCLRCLHPGFRLFPQARSIGSVSGVRLQPFDAFWVSVIWRKGMGLARRWVDPNDVMVMTWSMIFLLSCFMCQAIFPHLKKCTKRRPLQFCNDLACCQGSLLVDSAPPWPGEFYGMPEVVRNSLPVSNMLLRT